MRISYPGPIGVSPTLIMLFPPAAADNEEDVEEEEEEVDGAHMAKSSESLPEQG